MSNRFRLGTEAELDARGIIKGEAVRTRQDASGAEDDGVDAAERRKELADLW